MQGGVFTEAEMKGRIRQDVPAAPAWVSRAPAGPEDRAGRTRAGRGLRQDAQTESGWEMHVKSHHSVREEGGRGKESSLSFFSWTPIQLCHSMIPGGGASQTLKAGSSIPPWSPEESPDLKVQNLLQLSTVKAVQPRWREVFSDPGLC